MLDKTIDSALLNLRKQIIRGDGKGRDHVEALLRLRDVPMPRVPKPSKHKSRQLGRSIIAALRDDPRTARQIAEAIAPLLGLTVSDTYSRLHQALWRLEKAGVVRHEGQMWGLAIIC